MLAAACGVGLMVHNLAVVAANSAIMPKTRQDSPADQGCSATSGLSGREIFSAGIHRRFLAWIPFAPCLHNFII